MISIFIASYESGTVKDVIGLVVNDTGDTGRLSALREADGEQSGKTDRIHQMLRN